MDRAFIGALQVLLLVMLALVGYEADLGVWYYAAIGLAAALSAYQQYLIRDRERAGCFKAFSNNVWLGGMLYAAIVIDYIFA